MPMFFSYIRDYSLFAIFSSVKNSLIDFYWLFTNSFNICKS